MTGMTFISFTFFNTSLQMNAYMAALSVALFNCCVSASSCNIHSKNGTSAWKKAQKNTSLHWWSVTVFRRLFLLYTQRLYFKKFFYFTVATAFNGYSLNGYCMF